MESAEVQRRWKGSEVDRFRCRGQRSVVQRCRGARVQRNRGAEVQGGADIEVN